MYRKSFFAICISLLAAAWFGLHAVAAEDLPAATWYAVLNTQLSDQLVWINAQGVQATINRPHLPNEMPGPDAPRDVRISPDGRYGVFTATLMDNRIGLGFYDFQQGAFLQTHSAQPNEIISLGNPNSFFSDMSGIAIAFYTQTDAGITDWRIINFDPKTGNVLNLLQKSDNDVPAQVVGLGAYPYVFYAQDGTGYRFQMIPYAVGGSVNYEAYTWNPVTDVVTSDGMITTELDILPTTNFIVETGYEVGLPSVSLDGPIPILNVVTQRNSFDVAPTQLFHDAGASLFSPVWLRNGEWYAYDAAMPNDISYWVIRSVVGDSSYLFSDITPREIFGTSEGYLLDYEGQTFIASTELDSSNQPVIYEAPANDEARVVYVTPIGSFFTLAAVADGGVVVNAPTSTPTAQQPVATCDAAPPICLAAGMTARVTFTNGSVLRVRQAPGGTIITELSEGTGFKVVEGPTCLDGFNWWKIELEIVNGGSLTGWSAEGDADNYYIEPFQPNDPIPPLAITPMVFVTPKPPVLQITPLVITTLQVAPSATPLIFIPVPTKPLVIINPGFITDGDCSNAVVQYLSVGANVITQLDGTLAMRDTPTAEFPSNQIASGVTGKITDGPLCHGGFRRWKVEFSSGQTGWVPDSFGGNLYLKKN